jgi:hypothetical protein
VAADRRSRRLGVETSGRDLAERLSLIASEDALASVGARRPSECSYDGTVGFGITGDGALDGEVEILANGIKQTLSELWNARDHLANHLSDHAHPRAA